MEGKADVLRSQDWLQRIYQTATGKKKVTKEGLMENQDAIKSGIIEAVLELYDCQCINEKMIVSLANGIDEFLEDAPKCADQASILMEKLKKNIETTDRFGMLISAIGQGEYTKENNTLTALCKVFSQMDEKILKDSNKLYLIRQSLEEQKILNEDPHSFKEYLQEILSLSMEDAGQVYLLFVTMPENFIADIVLKTMDNYFFLSNMARKLKNTESIVNEVMQSEGLNETVTLSINEIYKEMFHDQSGQEEAAPEEIKTKEDVIDPQKEKEFQQLYELAGQGDKEAMLKLADYYFQGIGVEEDEEAAIHWLNIVYAEPDAKLAGEAAYKMGYIYSNGYLEEGYEQSLYWHQKAIELGNLDSYAELGEYYYYGYGEENEDERKALEIYTQGYKEAKRQNNHEVAGKLAYSIAEIYSFGDELGGNDREANRWYEAGMLEGNLESCVELGGNYEYGCGTRKNEKKALEVYKKGFEIAQQQNNEEFTGKMAFNVGDLYNYGDKLGENYQQANEWYKLAVEKENTDACFELGFNYKCGCGIEMDERKALELYFHGFEIAKKKEDPASAGKIAHEIGKLYRDANQIGKDINEAVLWYQKGVEAENVDSCIDLGDCYMNGTGVEMDPQKALELYQRGLEAAKKQENKDAIFKIEQKINKMV